MLKDFYIGDSYEYISVEYAKSARSSCRTCKSKIDKDQVRVGILVDDDHFSTGQGTAWFHKNCFNFKPRMKQHLQVQNIEKQIHGLDVLADKDRKEITAYLKQNLQLLKEGKQSKKNAQKDKSKQQEKKEINKSKPKQAEKSKPKQTEKSKSKPAKETQKSKAKKGSKKELQKSEQKNKSKRQVSKSKGNKNSKNEQKPAIEPQAKPQVKPKRGKSLAKSEKSISVERPTRNLRSNPINNIQPEKKLLAEKKPKTSKPAKKKFLSEAQVKEHKQLLADYNKLTTNELKEILQKNGQAKTGSKVDLVARCADGKQFGRTPACSKCGGGKLRFDRTNGTYKCPGYMEDTDFVHCNATFGFDEVKRQDWVQ